MEQVESGEESEEKRQNRRYGSEDDTSHAVLLQVLHVHLQTGKEHDEVDAYLAKHLERGIALKQVESVFAHHHTGKNHSD